MDAVDHPDERLRLAALERYRIVDSISEPEFDMLSRLVATICDTPISLVSLVDAERQWCKSTFGVESCTTSREFSFCARSLAQPRHVYVVPDAALDPTFAENPLVTGYPHVRFYAGVPLVTRDGFALGTLCVIDQRPRELSPAQYAALESAAGVVMSLIEQRLTVDALQNGRKRSDLMRSVADMASDAILILERDARATVRIVYANAAYERLTGMTGESVVGRDIETIRERTDASAAARRWIAASIEAGVPATNEVPILRADGSIGMAEVCIGPGEAADPDGRQNWLVVIRDIAALRRRDEARFAESHDASTGLSNEASLLRDLELRIANASSFAVACIDVERLDDPSTQRAPSNVAGEALAIGISRRLLATVDGNHTISRTGATEYAIVLDDGAASDAALATYLRDIAVPYRVGAVEAIVTASMGVARANAGPFAADILREARAKLAVAKIVDRSRRPSLEHRTAGETGDAARDRHVLGAALDAGEFRLDYQPIVELAGALGDVVVGFEALLRWPQGHARGWSPLDAIVAAERSGFIGELGTWIVDTACAQLALWQQGGAWGARRLSVNISPTQIERPTFVRDVRETLARYGCDPRGLTFELTETASMRDPLALRDVLVELRASEVAIDLDDFGTGYSSLSRLHTFAIDRLKIDREFVSGAGDGLANDRIVETILSLADRMGMTVVAEGVETRTQRDALRALGCRFAQGYLFARAMSAADATALLDDATAREPRAGSIPHAPE